MKLPNDLTVTVHIKCYAVEIKPKMFGNITVYKHLFYIRFREIKYYFQNYSSYILVT